MGFDVFDVARFDEALLHLERDGPFHLAGTQPAVKGGDEDRRQLDLGKDVHAHLLIGDGAQNQRDHANRKDRVGIFEGRAGQHAAIRPVQLCSSQNFQRCRASVTRSLNSPGFTT